MLVFGYPNLMYMCIVCLYFRDDSSPSDWVLAGYEGNNPKNELVVLGSGTGGLGELKEALQNDLVLYGLLRVSDRVDDITTTKFVYIMW